MLERSSRPPAEICRKLPTTGLLAITGGKVYSLLVNVSDVGSLRLAKGAIRPWQQFTRTRAGNNFARGRVPEKTFPRPGACRDDLPPLKSAPLVVNLLFFDSVS
jgi:hypothetical protein